MVRRLVSHREVRVGKWPRWVARKGLPSLLPSETTSTIQLVPIHSARMCSGASLARSVQVMVRPWLFS